MALRSRIAENAMENLMGYSRSLYEVASEAQSELSKLAEERMSSFQQAMTEGRRPGRAIGARGQRPRDRRDEVVARRHHRGLRHLRQGRQARGELRRCRRARSRQRQIAQVTRTALPNSSLLLLYRRIG